MMTLCKGLLPPTTNLIFWGWFVGESSHHVCTPPFPPMDHPMTETFQPFPHHHFLSILPNFIDFHFSTFTIASIPQDESMTEKNASNLSDVNGSIMG
jgi:hypothetical protein